MTGRPETAAAAVDPHAAEEVVVLVDEAGRALGTLPKALAHGRHTPRHLGFSCYVMDPAGRLLVSRRAHDKATFPGVRTNSVCGHPMPGERLAAAVVRRARTELGLAVDEGAVRLVLPGFGYRAQLGGVVEFEACPVMVATVPLGAAVDPDPVEVAEAHWLPWAAYRDGVLDGSLAVSAWSAEQVPLLAALGDDPAHWPDADPALLPPAARW